MLHDWIHEVPRLTWFMFVGVDKVWGCNWNESATPKHIVILINVEPRWVVLVSACEIENRNKKQKMYQNKLTKKLPKELRKDY